MSGSPVITEGETLSKSRIKPLMSDNDVRRQFERQERCNHKFVDSRHCLKCGWDPGPKPKPKRDDILERPEEDPGYGHGV